MGSTLGSIILLLLYSAIILTLTEAKSPILTKHGKQVSNGRKEMLKLLTIGKAVGSTTQEKYRSIYKINEHRKGTP